MESPATLPPFHAPQRLAIEDRFLPIHGETDDRLAKCLGLPLGTTFNVLVAIDGGAGDLPAMKLVLDPHPDDRAFAEANMEDWFEPGMELTDAPLHELLCKGREDI